MRHLLHATILAVALGLAACADFQAGLDAYHRGDYAAAVSEWKPLAVGDRGEADARYNLGHLYEKGLGVPKDPTEALSWFRAAAEKGSVPARIKLGNMYRKGEGVAEDFAEAAKWYRDAAGEGDRVAQLYLGRLYAMGRGVPKDEKHAFELFRESAVQGHPPAKAALGYLYEKGVGIPRDYAEALAWYRKAAAGGNKFAAKAVARLQGDPKVLRQAERRRLAEGRRLAGETRPGTPEKMLRILAAPSFDEAWRAQARMLALSFLLTLETTRWLEENMTGFLKIKKNTSADFNVEGRVYYPDGTSQKVDMKTIEALEQFVADSRRLIAKYENVIKARGFKTLASSYVASASPGCSAEWITSGELAVSQNGFKFEVSQGGKPFSGAVVEDMVTIYTPPEVMPTLFGKYGKTIELRELDSKCKITLAAPGAAPGEPETRP